MNNEGWNPEWLRRVVTSHWDEDEYEVICRLHNGAILRCQSPSVGEEEHEAMCKAATKASAGSTTKPESVCPICKTPVFSFTKKVHPCVDCAAKLSARYDDGSECEKLFE